MGNVDVTIIVHIQLTNTANELALALAFDANNSEGNSNVMAPGPMRKHKTSNTANTPGAESCDFFMYVFI